MCYPNADSCLIQKSNDMDHLFLIAFLGLLCSSLIFSQLNTSIACPHESPHRANCRSGDHIVLKSISLLAKDLQCSSLLHNDTNPSSLNGCCNVTASDKQLASFELPSDDTTVKTKFSIAINSCSFDRDSCIIPTKPEVFQMEYGGRNVDVVAYTYRCVNGKSAYSICGGTAPVKATSVVVRHDGAAAGAAVGCQCSLSSSSCTSHISVRILYRKNSECSLSLSEGNSSRLLKCGDRAAKLESVGNSLLLNINSSDTNVIALEFSETNGSDVIATCGRNLPTYHPKPCLTSTSTSTSTSPSTSTSRLTSTSTRTSSRLPKPNVHTSSPAPARSGDVGMSNEGDSLKYVIAGCVSGAVVITVGLLLLRAFFKHKKRVNPLINKEAVRPITSTVTGAWDKRAIY